MPRGNGTGPTGAGPLTGRGGGDGGGRGMGAGQGRGAMGGFSLGTGGNCVCPKCGKSVAHERGTPCTRRKCPACGSAMTRAT